MNKKPFKILKAIAIRAVFVYLIVLGFLYFGQEKMIFYPDKIDSNKKLEFFAPFEEININVDNININGVRFFADKNVSKNKAVIFYHGNTGNVDSWSFFASDFTLKGYDFYLFDYRGFGKSQRSNVTTEQLLEDTDEMVKVVLKDFSPDKITAFGYSLGGGLALRVAQKYNLSKAIIVSTYFDFKRAATQILPIVPRFLVRYDIPTYKYLNDYKNPVLLIHGSEDGILGVNNSRDLTAYLKPSDRYLEVAEGHNDVLYNQEVWDEIRAFLNEDENQTKK